MALAHRHVALTSLLLTTLGILPFAQAGDPAAGVPAAQIVLVGYDDIPTSAEAHFIAPLDVDGVVDGGRDFPAAGVGHTYDPTSNLARTNAHLDGYRLAPQTTSLADEAVTTGRTASTSWGRTVQNFEQYGDQWRRVSAHAEATTGRAYRGGTSIEEVFERGTDRLVRHRIYGPNGEVLHETFRPNAKFGAP